MSISLQKTFFHHFIVRWGNNNLGADQSGPPPSINQGIIVGQGVGFLLFAPFGMLHCNIC